MQDVDTPCRHDLIAPPSMQSLFFDWKQILLSLLHVLMSGIFLYSLFVHFSMFYSFFTRIPTYMSVCVCVCLRSRTHTHTTEQAHGRARVQVFRSADRLCESVSRAAAAAARILQCRIGAALVCRSLRGGYVCGGVGTPYARINCCNQLH